MRSRMRQMISEAGRLPARRLHCPLLEMLTSWVDVADGDDGLLLRTRGSSPFPAVTLSTAALTIAIDHSDREWR